MITSTSRAKRRLYQEQLISEYWIVDADRRQVEVWTPDAHFPMVESTALRWRHSALEQECAVSLAEVFR